MIDNIIKETQDGINIFCQIQAGASKNNIVGVINNEFLKIQIQCPPVDGKANAQIIKYLSKVFDVSKSSIIILKGEKQKIKCIQVVGISKEEAIKILENLINSD